MGIRGDRKKGSQLKRIDQENSRQESSGGRARTRPGQDINFDEITD